LLGVVLATHIAPRTGADLSENLGLILMAGALAGILAVLVFYIISQRLILSPVRELRHVADEVAAGNHSVRSRIETGDEFEDLARAFNSMLAHLQEKQEELRTINVSLDTRLGDLAERNVALFESNRVKSQFVANVSHELRTPLTSIIGFAELLREGGVDDGDRRRRYLQNILDSGRMLLGLINDLLDLAKMEAGKFTLHRGAVNLRDMIQNLISFMQPLADKKELALVAEVGADVPEVVSDSGRIQQILYNLLSNAIKFSEPGGRVSTRIAREGDEHVVIVIEDTGIGIPAPQLADIFEKFRQLDGSMTREYGGAGLGLAITRELVHMLGGSISVRSEEGRGSEFRVLLPTSAPETAVATPISLS
ncbi:MAG: ATP-binding protein, partial [Phycisphaerae bacterium]